MFRPITDAFKLVKKRYILFTTVIVLTIIAGVTTIYFSLHNENRSAAFLRLSARQMLLSQRIAKRVFYSYAALTQSNETPASDIDTLQKLCTEFQNAHYKLLGIYKQDHSSNVYTLLNANTPYLNNIINACKALAGNNSYSNFKTVATIVRQNEKVFLQNQESVTTAIQKEYENKIFITEEKGLAIAAFTILCLILEFIFIIAPLVKKLKISNNSLIDVQGILSKTYSVAKVGGWEADLVNNKIYWTSITKEIHEVPDDFTPDIKTAISFFKEGKSRDTITTLMNNAMNKGEAFDTQLIIVTAKGNEKWVRAKGEVEFLNDKYKRVFGTIQDIHSEKLKDIQLEQSEELFRKTFNHAASGMALVYPEGKWFKVNQGFCNIVGYSEEELQHLDYKTITHPDDLQHDIKLHDELIEDKISAYQIEKRYFNKNGNIVWAKLSVSLVRDEMGKPLYFISQITDITKEKIAEKTIKEERTLLKAIIDNIPVNVFVKDLQSRKILVNRKEMEYMGVKDEAEILGKDDYELFPEESADISVTEDQQVINTGVAFTDLETINTKFNGVQSYFLTSKIPLKNDENKITGLLGLSYNITQRKETEKNLRELVKITGEQNRRLLNFAHIVSHNLRSHSANFSLLLNFLEVENDENEKLKMFGLLKKASSNLAETVQHLNQVVDIHSNISEKIECINLRKAVTTVQNNVSALMLKENVQSFNNVDEHITIHAVPAYLDSILLNLFTNTIKYKSAERTPYIRLHAVKEKEYVILSVEDNGLGIDMKKYGDKLFGMYNTFHGNKDAKGIGLFITKNQVEVMGGKIEVESTLGQGTIFKIFFYEKN